MKKIDDNPPLYGDYATILLKGLPISVFILYYFWGVSPLESYSIFLFYILGISFIISILFTGTFNLLLEKKHVCVGHFFIPTFKRNLSYNRLEKAKLSRKYRTNYITFYKANGEKHGYSFTLSWKEIAKIGMTLRKKGVLLDEKWEKEIELYLITPPVGRPGNPGRLI